MEVCSIESILGLLLASAVFFLLPSVRLRQSFMALLSLGFLYTLVPDTPSWIALSLFLGTGYAAASVLRRHPRRVIVVIYLVALLAFFVILKQYAFARLFLPASLFNRVLAVVGLSYMLFRQIQVVVDAYQGQLEEFSLWNYLNYQLNLFALVAGPIQRYQEFCLYWMQLRPVLTDPYDMTKAYLRIFVGVIKIMALAQLCLTLYSGFAEEFTQVSGWKVVFDFLLIMYLFPAYLYFNFSGYCDIVIAGASLLGIKMPENFDYPFLARNMIDFWTRWHRTLGFWTRDYLFTPMTKAFTMRWPSYAVGLSFVSYMVTFLLIGIWHGATFNFVILGLLNGLGVAAAKIWETIVIKRVGRRGFREYLQSSRIRVLAVVGNFHYVCFMSMFFPSDLQRTLAILRHAITLH